MFSLRASGDRGGLDEGANGVDADGEADGELTDADAPAPAREGLPPSYRMRAEPHYVETLVEPAEARAVVASAAMASAAATMADAFEAIQASLRDVPVRGRPLRDRVAIELARAEATRGRWLADAAVVLQTDPLPALDELDLVRLLTNVYDALGPENRLSGGAAAAPRLDGTCRVFGDERLLTTALGGILGAFRALLEDRGDARRVLVALGPRRDAGTRTLEITQTALRLPVAAYARFFEAGWADHPAGASGAMLLAAARKIALAHGGTLGACALETGGSRLVLSLPAAD